MKSTGEVMGIDKTFGKAFAKSQVAANQSLPRTGKIFLSVNDHDKQHVSSLAKRLISLGFGIVSTRGTAEVLKTSGVSVETVDKLDEGKNNLLTFIKKDEINLIINTPSGKKGQSDMIAIWAAAIMNNIPCITTVQGAWAAVNGIDSSLQNEDSVQSLQDYYKQR